MSAPVFRPAEGRDLDAVYALVCDMEAKELPYAAFAEIFSAQLADGARLCLVCELDGAVAAVCNLRFEYQLHHAARVAEIMELAVAPGYRNRGLGADLLREAAVAALAQGCVQMELACNTLRRDAHRFYEREGFKRYHYKFSKPLAGADEGNALGR